MGTQTGGHGEGVKHMKCVNGVWYHRGRSFPTLYAALVAAWPRALSPMEGQKEAAPGTANTGSGKDKNTLE